MPFSTFCPLPSSLPPPEIGILFCLYPFCILQKPFPGCSAASSSIHRHPAAELAAQPRQRERHCTGPSSTWLIPKPPTAAHLCTFHFAGALQLSSVSKQCFSAISAESENASARAAASPRGNVLVGNNYREFKQGRSAAKLLHIQAPGQEGRAQKLLVGTVRKYLAPAPIMGVHRPWAKITPYTAAPWHPALKKGVLMAWRV